MKDEIPLGVVNEEVEFELDHSTSKMTPILQSSMASGFASPENRLKSLHNSEIKIADSQNPIDSDN